MEWSEDKVLCFIEAVREKGMIWDPNNILKKKKYKRADAFRELMLVFPPATAEELSSKWKNLCQAYRNIRQKVVNSIKSGAGREDVYTPSWFAYNTMDAFINDTYTPLSSTDAVSTL